MSICVMTSSREVFDVKRKSSRGIHESQRARTCVSRLDLSYYAVCDEGNARQQVISEGHMPEKRDESGQVPMPGR